MINGKTRFYENIGENLQALVNARQQYDFHLKTIYSKLSDQFRVLKEEHKAGQIDSGTYIEFLKILKSFFDDYEVYGNDIPSQYSGAMKEAIKEHCKW